MNTLKKIEKTLQFESFHLRHEFERISSELDFAAKLAERHSADSAKFKKLIDKARKHLDDNFSPKKPEAFPALVREAEKILEPIGKTAKKYTVHCVGHAHIDMNWMWSWPETVAVVNDTFSTVLKLMEEYPGFTFSQSQASIYAILEKYNPEMLSKIAKRVQEGRWEVTASHWVEGDKNLIGGESLSRHLLYTRRYMEELFKLKPEDVPIDWSPDTFGHSANIPAYLAQGGIKYYYLHRPGYFKGVVPEAFWWKGTDGSKVLVKNDMYYAYNGKVSPAVTEILFKFTELTKGFNSIFVYGVGDHGGGPTRCDLNRIIEMEQWPVFPRIEFSTALRFFEALEKEANKLPVLEGELNVEFTGCYTTQSLIKKANRFSENRLADAELAAVTDWKLNSQSYPAESLEKNWRDCLFNHFHDILPGSGVRDTRHYTMGLFQNIMADTSMIETQALRRIASMINTRAPGAKDGNIRQTLPPAFYSDAFGAGAGIDSAHGCLSTYELSSGMGTRPFAVFNPTAADRKEIIEVTIWDNPIPGESTPLKDKKFAVRNPDGKLLPAQFVSEGTGWGHRYVKIAFPVEVAGLGYSLYTVVEEDAGPCKSKLKLLQRKQICSYINYERADRYGCENEFAVLEINPVTGGILRLHDKKSGVDVISSGRDFPALEFGIERPHHMSAWCIEHCDHVEAPAVKSISYSKEGPYKIAIKVDAVIRSSKFTVTYEMQENNPLVSIHIKGSWLEVGGPEIGCPSLRMPFAASLDAPAVSYEIPFGAISRDIGNDIEVPAMQWAKVAGSKDRKKAGFLLLNDCKHGHAFDGSVMRISLIRSSYSPDPIPEVGEHEINLALLPFAGDITPSKATEYGQAFNHNLKPVGTSVHDGKLSASGSFIKVSGPGVVLSGIKKAEDSNAIILRFYETDGGKSKFKVSFDKAFASKVKSACAVDMMEREAKDNPVRLSANCVEAVVNANSIISIKVTF